MGGLQATVTQTATESSVPVGSSAIVTVTITQAGGNRFAAISAEAEGGEIFGISGSGARTSPIRGGLSAEIDLTAKGPATVTVEMNLKGGSKDTAGKPRSRLRITLLPQKGGRDEAVYSWGLADCAGDYYAQLLKIFEARRQRMMAMLDVASAVQPEFPVKWIFPADTAAQSQSCKAAKGKLKATCAGAQPVTDTGKDGAAMWDEARLLRLAGDVQAVRGALPGFQQRHQPLRQVSYTLLSGLRTYMEQAPHPALCSGVTSMVDYFFDRTPLLRNTIRHAQEAAKASAALANSKVAELAGVAAPGAPATQSGAAPAVISSANAAAAVAAALSPAELIDRAGKAILPSDAMAQLAAEPAPLAKLQFLRLLLADGTAPEPSAARKQQARAVLHLIEAGIYLDAAAKKYSALDETVYGTMSAITSAHQSACTCEQ